MILHADDVAQSRLVHLAKAVLTPGYGWQIAAEYDGEMYFYKCGFDWVEWENPGYNKGPSIWTTEDFAQNALNYLREIYPRAIPSCNTIMKATSLEDIAIAMPHLPDPRDIPEQIRHWIEKLFNHASVETVAPLVRAFLKNAMGSKWDYLPDDVKDALCNKIAELFIAALKAGIKK